MARFGNIIAHGHARIDPDSVAHILRHDLDDLTRFRLAAQCWR
jgi:uncharacterized protein YutE (UPF0331/DUF86 family)